MAENTLSDDQIWCLAKALYSAKRGATAMEKLFTEAAKCAEKATICRNEVNRAARAIRGMKKLTK